MMNAYDKLYKILGLCPGCEKPVRDRRTDYYIKLCEVLDGKDLWVRYFHSWKCLTVHLIKSKKVKVIAVD